jgi:hypothetical protein
MLLLKHGHHFDCFKQPLNMHMHLCHLDFHEARLCCYLEIHIENIISIKAVLLPFVTYLPILPHIYNIKSKHYTKGYHCHTPLK